MDRKQIMDRLTNHMLEVTKEGFLAEQIFGVFLYGSQNYGTATENSDIDSYVIILPLFEDICLNKQPISKEIKYKNEDDIIHIKDIRLIREMFMKQNINFLEILYSDYGWVNPKYADLYGRYFVKNREKISHFDIEKAFTSIRGQIHQKLDRARDRKDISDAYRLLFFLEDYLSGKPYINCIQQSGESLKIIQDIKSNPYYVIDEERCKLEIKAAIADLVEKYPVVESPHRDEAQLAIDTGIIEILKEHFGMNKSKLSKNDFFKKLTNTEKKAYQSLVIEVGEDKLEGNITISKLVEKNSISRPVYNNLLNKMKEYNVAEVVNQGVKGTFIKIKM